MSTSFDEALNVLIVDDDEVDRMALRRTLKGVSLSITVTEASDADSALAHIQRDKLRRNEQQNQQKSEQATEFDCIFLDYHLPGKNGLALVKQIRHLEIQVPLIVLTGQGNEQTAVELMKAGATDYLPKSRLSVETITRLVRSAIRVYRAEQNLAETNRRLRDKNQLLEQKNQELERQRRQIYKQNLQLQEVSRLKSEFLATMSHELRTPLNAIIGFSQILLNKTKGPLTSYQQDMLNRVLSNGRNLLELINDILSFSRIEAGRLELEPIAFDLPELMYSTVEELRSLAAQKSIDLETSIHLENPVIINDAARVRQIVVNLLSNAIKFTSRGSVRVRVEAIAKPPEARSSEQIEPKPFKMEPVGTRRQPVPDERELSDRIVISVSDTGCGISALDQVYIFDAFHQADQKVTRKHAGTGLGLAITHSLVNMMGGKITVQSEVEKGTTFRVELPRQVKIEKQPTRRSEISSRRRTESPIRRFK